jgi:superfamily I DNA and/or RNA helicase
MSEVQERLASNVVTSENLVDWNMNRLGLAAEEAPVEAETVEETPESEPIEQAQGESEPASEPETKATEERKQNPKLEKRFSELTKARKEAEDKAAKAQAEKEALEERLRQFETVSTQPKEIDPVGDEPRADQFTDAIEYAKALAMWSTEKALYERDKQEAERKAAEEQAKIQKLWSEKLEKAKPNLPDFDDLVTSSNVQVSNEIRDAILESDVGPQILYELASNTEYANKVAGMPLIKALREIGKLEARFEQETAEPAKKPVAVQSKAPAPISPLKGTGSAEVITSDTDKLTYAQYKELRKARRIR